MSRVRYAQKDIRRIYYQQSKTLSEDVLAQAYAGGEINIELLAYVENVCTVSDRPKYGPHPDYIPGVYPDYGTIFYDGRAKLPKVERKLPPLLSTQLSFSELSIEINNCDGKYNRFLVGGEVYTPMFGRRVELKVGLGDISRTYFPIFRGVVHTEGGMERNRESIVIRARDEFEFLNSTVPLPKFTKEEFSALPDDVVGKLIPLCLGDWSYGLEFTNSPITTNVDVGGVQTAVRTKKTDKVGGGTIGYYTGAGKFVFSVGGNHEGSFSCMDIDDCVIKRGDHFLRTSFDSTHIEPIGYLGVQVNGLIRDSDGATVAYTYASGDVAVIRTKVSWRNSPTFENEDSNPIYLAREFLITCGRLNTVTDFSTSWETVANNKSTSYPQSNMRDGIKARIWVGEANTNILDYAIGLLRQVRCDLYVDKQRNFSVIPLFHENIPGPSAISRHIQETHVMERTVSIKTDKRNVFTSADCTYGFTPVINGTSTRTSKYKNNNAIAITSGEVAKSIDLPNLYREDDAIYQLIEIIRFYSASIETITANIGWLHINADLGDWVTVSLPLGTVTDSGETVEREIFYRVPCQIRGISIEPEGGSIEMELLSIGNFPVPQYTPPFSENCISAYNQTIVKDS